MNKIYETPQTIALTTAQHSTMEEFIALHSLPFHSDAHQPQHHSFAHLGLGT